MELNSHAFLICSLRYKIYLWDGIHNSNQYTDDINVFYLRAIAYIKFINQFLFLYFLNLYPSNLQKL